MKHKGVSPRPAKLQAATLGVGMGVSPAAEDLQAEPLPPERVKVEKTRRWRPPAAAGGTAYREEACPAPERNLQAGTVTAPRRARRRQKGVRRASWHLQAEAATTR